MRDASLVPSALTDAAGLARILSVSKPTIWRLKEAGKLPKEISLTAQCVRWRLRTGSVTTGVLDWIDAGCPNIGEASVSHSAKTSEVTA